MKELEKENAVLITEKAEILQETETLRKQLEALKVENSKTREVALEVQKVLTEAMKDANFHTFNKDKEIEKLVKENERLKAENSTYKELLSPAIVQQRALESREIATKTQARNNNSDNHIYVGDPRTEAAKDGEVYTCPMVTVPAKNTASFDGSESKQDAEDEDDFYPERRPDLNETSNHSPGQQRSRNREEKARFCHFYNRNGCNIPNCSFVHDVAPICGEYLKGRCKRRFCQFRHENKENFQHSSTRKPPDQERHQGQDSQNRWVSIGPKKPPYQMEQPHSDRRLPHHRYRYKKDPQQDQDQWDHSADYQNNSNRLTSYQSYPPMDY